jgi:RNA polymerase sigma-70 factor (ECF subfamily)
MKEVDGSDELLMHQVAGGERAALSLLLRRYADPLFTFLRRMGVDHQRSEDLFQETFLAVWAARAKYEFPRPFRPWLFGIALNKCRADHRRPSWRAVPGPVPTENSVVSPAPSPVDTAVATETATLVQGAVLRLPPRQCEVVVLRVWGGLSYAEIAAALGCGEAAVRSNMFHGLAAMRKYLEPRLR